MFTAVGLFFGLVSPQALWAYRHPQHPPLPDLDRRTHTRAQPPQLRPAQAAARERLRQRVPRLRTDFDPIRLSPHFVASPESFLTGPGGRGKGVSADYGRRGRGGDPHWPVKAFVDEHAALFGHGADAIAQARVRRDDASGPNGLRSVVWEQHVDGIPVYEGVLVGHITRDGELVSVASLFVPQPAAAADAGGPRRAALVAAPPVPAARAVVAAAGSLEEAVGPQSVWALGEAVPGAERRQGFRAGHLPGEAEARLVWLPMDAATLRLCWQVELTRPAGNERYRVLVDAQTGEVLMRRCLTVYLADATYRVFTSDSPSPFSPGHRAPSTNQPPRVPRRLLTFPALSTNASPLGWIHDGDNETRGNNVDAHLDRDADNSPDFPRPQGAPFRVFDFPLDLSQAPTRYSQASVVQLFYWCNWMHDQLYDLGFTEAAGNFQKDNIGRGGLGSDPVLADAQDGSGWNNANFTPTCDGTPPRIQMFLFDGPQPARDGSLDAEIVLHEYTHGLTDRLVGGGVGLGTLQAYGLAEGWSDWYALALLSEPDDDLDGTYAMGGYATWQFYGLVENYYYGIRRYPYCTDLAVNPLTFKDIDPFEADLHVGVPINPILGYGDPSEVHNQGEVWCMALWEIRANLIRQHGFAQGNRLALQLVTDALKLTPPNPNFIQARDAILQADLVNTGGANYNTLWAGFAKRGLGFSAQAPTTLTTVGVREFFDLPDGLLITSADPVTSSGPAGGPFFPECRTFVLTNHTSQALDWVLRSTVPWLTTTSDRGTLEPAAAATVSARINPQAAALTPGVYTGTLAFSNATSGFTQTRDIRLRVLGFAGLPFREGFETGMFQPCWSVSGTGPFRTRVTTDPRPHGGSHHVTLDAWADSTYARNELTLGIDLTGYTNVVLRFWAREFGDDPHGPPAGSFVDGADFDGVAISADGVHWHEAHPLRTLPLRDTEVEVALDAAAAAAGLAYNDRFQIRFNQYDNNSIPLDGIALDDIEITGVPARRFQLTLPAEATEGDGLLARSAVIALGAPVPADLRVVVTSSDPLKVAVPATVTLPAGAQTAAFDLRLPDNALLDGTQPVRISVAAAEHVAASAIVNVHDNETGRLELKIEPQAREGDPPGKRLGTVRVKPRPDRPITVALASGDPSEVRVPPTVVVPAGHLRADFDLTILNDLDLDGPQLVTVTAHVEHWIDGHDTIRVRDDDKRRLKVRLPALVTEGSGLLANAGVVLLDARQPTPVTVALACEAPGRLVLPEGVLIPAGQFSAPFDLTLPDNPSLDGRQDILVTASAKGFPAASATIGVLDDETPLVPYQPAPADGAAAVPVSLTLTWGPGAGEALVNGDFETGDFTGWEQIHGGLGGIVINDGSVNPDGPDGPLPPFAGHYAALVHQTGSGSHELFQDVTIPAEAKAAVLSWAHRVRNHADRFAPRAHEFRMEVRTTNHTVLETLYRTEPGHVRLDDWVEVRHDLAPYRGQRVRLAFAEVDSLSYFNLHLDHVRLNLGDPSATTFEVFFGTSPVLGPAQSLGTTRAPFWPLPKLAVNTTYYWQVVTRLGAAEARSPVWRFTTRSPGPAARLEWAPLPPWHFADQPFRVALTALDDAGLPAESYDGRVALRLVPGQETRSAVVVTEIDPGGNDRVEFMNVSGRWLNLAGWQLVLYDVVTWPNPCLEFVVPTNSLAPPGGLFVLNRFGKPPGAYPNFYSGTNVFWDYVLVNAPVAVMVRDASGALVDFACAADANPALITNPVVVPRWAWSGAPIAATTNSPRTYQRVGQADHNCASDWEATDSSIGRWNPDLIAPFTNGVPLLVQPDTLTGFAKGVWQGDVVLPQTHDQVTLLAEDDAGRWAATLPFTVLASNDLAVTVRDDPNVVLVADDVTYHITVTNSGSGTATGVWLTNRLDPAAVCVSATAADGACTVSEGTVLCRLADLPGGTETRVAIHVRPRAPGLLTNLVAVARAESDSHLANNTAVAVTTAVFPTLSVAESIVFENDPSMPAAMFDLRLSAPSRLPVGVTFLTRDGTAIAGQDYVAVEANLVLAPGTVVRSVPVPILDDPLSEDVELFTVELRAPLRATLGVAGTFGAILDDDPLPRLSIDDVALLEGPDGTATNALFQVRLSEPAALPVAARFKTGDGLLAGIESSTLPAIAELPGLGSATALEDYMPASGTLSIPPGTTSQVVAVSIRGDRFYEGAEAFSLVLSTPYNCTLADPVGLAAILDDDEAELARYELHLGPGPFRAGAPFPLTVTARDGLDRVVEDFSGAVRLSGFPDLPGVDLGTGNRSWKYPLNAFFHDARLQVIYPAGDIAQTGTISAITLPVESAPGQILHHWTVRMKHTPLARYTTAAWETDGWTTVHARDLLVPGAGGMLCFLDTPFAYDGTDNLMVDFSFNNDSYTADGACVASATPEPRSAFFESDSAFGDPLGWSAATAPPPLITNLAPNLRMLIGPPVSIAPARLEPFTRGVWSGTVAVADPVPVMRLRVEDADRRQGLSAAFGVEPPPPAAPDALASPNQSPAASPPLPGATRVRITAVRLEPHRVVLRFASARGQRYRVEWADDPGAGPWTLLADALRGTGAELEIADAESRLRPRRFYRVSVLPQAR